MAVSNSFLRQLPEFFQRQVRSASVAPQDIPMDVFRSTEEEPEEDTFNNRKAQGHKTSVAPGHLAGVSNAAGPDGLVMARSAAAWLPNLFAGLSEPCTKELPRLVVETAREKESNSQGNNNNNDSSTHKTGK